MSGLQNITTLVALATGTLNINVARNPASLALFTSTDVRINGTVLLTGNLNISPSGTPIKNTAIKILWEALVTITPASGNQVIIFGKVVPDELVGKNFVAECVYDGTGGPWVVNILTDFAGVGIVAADRIAANAVTTAKIADDAVTLAKMQGQTDGKVYVGDTALGVVSVSMSGDATIAKTGALTIGSGAITTAKILDANVTPAKLSASSNKGQFAVQLEFDEAAKIGVIKYQICSTCTIDGIYATVNRVPATDTATVIPKNHGGVAMTGGQIDITTALALGNIISVTPTANNTFTAGEQMALETSKTTAEACTITVVVCYTVTA
jgi:hypothetical protein